MQHSGEGSGTTACDVDSVTHISEQFSQMGSRDRERVIERLHMIHMGARNKAVDAVRGIGGYAAAQCESEQTSTKAVPSRGLTLDTVERCFTYQAWDSGQVRQAEPVREAILALARAILRHSPDCPDRSSGLRKLRELRMDINSAITHRGEF